MTVKSFTGIFRMVPEILRGGGGLKTPRPSGTDHYFSTGGSHFGKINCLHTKMNEKIVSRKISLKKNCLHNIGKVEKSFLL